MPERSTHLEIPSRQAIFLTMIFDVFLPNNIRGDEKLLRRARGVVRAFFSVSSIGVVVSLCYPLIRSSITAEELTAIWGCTASPIVGAILLRLNVKIGVAIVTTYGLGMASLLLYAAQSFGFDVRVVSSANGFMELYDHGEPSVIVMDIFMPDMDGIELLIWLGDRQCTSHIVLMSGHGPQYLKSATNIASARGVRIVGTLSKPFEIDDLEALLQVALDARAG